MDLRSRQPVGDIFLSMSSPFLRSIRTAAWAFLGVRKRAGHDDDLAHVRPGHIIAAGLLLGLVFVLLVMLAVHLVTT
ncbi:hypothetical protein CDEF62S_05451 [Castellaniella defragrans]